MSIQICLPPLTAVVVWAENIRSFFFLFRNKLVMLPGNFVQWRMDRNMTLINGSYWNFRLVVVIWMVPRHRLFRSNIVRNQGHFEPANNYQRYNVLHSGTIVYRENSIWRRSRLDLQRSVFRTMTYTIWALQIFYLMKRKRKEDLQVNLWDFSRQSDDMMSEFLFAFLLNFRTKMTEFAFNAWHIFIP